MRCRVFLSLVCFVVVGMVLTAQAKPIHVSPDGPTLLTLEEDAASVIVGNPAHASVMLDNPRTVMINAGVPGMTNLIILGRNGKVILNKPVISGAASGDMIRIQNACINGGDGCITDKMFYCADGERCHTVAVPQAQQSGGIGGSSTPQMSSGPDGMMEEGTGQ